ncbi:hypothetical protein OPT61_g10624 [Boeremia exigua]|uniref:Uncharacterized protein n=1 Tax=Boeremia exigua TaxID=749465 RepID=A0ACC2HNR9_9PLEO|nr:hypothetical protein OPT61_g10624 [Boeremia exigua]
MLPLEIFEDAWREARYVLENLSVEVGRTDESEEINELGRWHVAQLPTLIDAEADETIDASAGACVGEGPAGEGAAKAGVGDCRMRACAVAKPNATVAAAGEGVTVACAVLAVVQRAGDGFVWTADGGANHIAGLRLGVEHDAGGHQTRAAARWHLSGTAHQSIGSDDGARAETALDEHHPARLASQHALAVAYRDNGQIGEAVELLELVVKIKEAMDERHPDRLISQHALAMAYSENGQLGEAIELLEHVVEETTYERHPDQLATQHNLALAYRNNRQMREAVELLEHVVMITQVTMAETHPHRLLDVKLACFSGRNKEAWSLWLNERRSGLVVCSRRSTAQVMPPDRAGAVESTSIYAADLQYQARWQLSGEGDGACLATAGVGERSLGAGKDGPDAAPKAGESCFASKSATHDESGVQVSRGHAIR